MAKKHTRAYRTWVAIKEMQMEATVSCHFYLSGWQKTFKVPVLAQP